MDIDAAVSEAREMVDKAKAVFDPRASLSGDPREIRTHDAIASLIQSVEALVDAVEQLSRRGEPASAELEPETMRQRLHRGEGPLFPRPASD